MWCWDFVEDSDHRGRPLRWLTLVDEFTRECLLLEVERSMSGDRVRDLLAEAIRSRGVPGHLRSDNGSEFIATKLRQFLKATEIETLYIEPGEGHAMLPDRSGADRARIGRRGGHSPRGSAPRRRAPERRDRARD